MVFQFNIYLGTWKRFKSKRLISKEKGKKKASRWISW